MSALRSALDEMLNESDDNLSAGQVGEDLVELEHASQIIEVIRARRIGAFQDKNVPGETDHPSPTAFLMHACRMAAGRARRLVAHANAARRAAGTARAWADGRLSTDQATHLFRVSEAVPDVFLEAEEELVEIVEPLSVSHTAQTLAYWRQSVDGPGELSQDSQQVRRGLSVSETIGGMRRVDGWLTDTAGEAFEKALDAHMPPPSDDDTRNPRQRRHDAFEEMARCHLDHEDTPGVGGEKPHVMVVTDVDGLRGVGGGTHETLSGRVLGVETIRMLACDASVSRIVLGPDSEVLDVGRKTRVWSPAQRRAIVVRDRHCTTPGCERPPHWCDIHHEDHWADGGTTSVDKGKLLCRFHHTLEHIKLTQRQRSRTKG